MPLPSRITAVFSDLPVSIKAAATFIAVIQAVLIYFIYACGASVLGPLLQTIVDLHLPVGSANAVVPTLRMIAHAVALQAELLSGAFMVNCLLALACIHMWTPSRKRKCRAVAGV